MRPNVLEKPGIIMTGYEAMDVIAIVAVVSRIERVELEQGSDEQDLPVASADFEISHRASRAVLTTLSVAERLDPARLTPETQALPARARQMLVEYNAALKAQ